MVPKYLSKAHFPFQMIFRKAKMTPQLDHAYPDEFQCDAYREANHDLAGFTAEQLAVHYERHGRDEGRAGNRLVNRDDFISLIPSNAKVLEIGPYLSPVARGSKVAYADYLSTGELQRRAEIEGHDPSLVPQISHILSKRPLGEIDADFDIVVSSHCIEHQPNFVKHIQDVERLIRSRHGSYFVLVPDKWFCFDHFLPESSIAQVLHAYFESRSVHWLQAIIEHRALTVHNDAKLHWATRPEKLEIDSVKVASAIKEWQESGGQYIDVHAWYFTPASFVGIITLLTKLQLTKLKVDRIYPTRRNNNEFWAILNSSDDPN